MKNIGVFIDYDNVSICLEKYYEFSKESTRKDLKMLLINKIKEKFSDDKIITIKAFADFQKINPQLTILQKNQVELRHIYSSNERKNASDIALAIDVIKSLFTNNLIDKYVIVSSDSDMLPIINEINHSGKDILVIYSKFNSVQGYDEYNSDSISIEELLDIDEYKKVEYMDVIQRIDKFMNIINSGINEIYKKHGNGTANKTNLSEYIFNYIQITRNDAIQIIEILLKSGFILETPIAGGKYKKLLINESKINEYNEGNSHTIELKECVTKESDFRK